MAFSQKTMTKTKSKFAVKINTAAAELSLRNNFSFSTECLLHNLILLITPHDRQRFLKK